MPGSFLRIVAIVALIGQSLLVGREVARGFVCLHGDAAPLTAAGWADQGSSGHHASSTVHSGHSSADEHTHEDSEPAPCECGADCSLCPPPLAPTVQPTSQAFAFDPAPTIAPVDADDGFVRVRVRYLHPPSTAPPHTA